jgi:hypothetical protein
MAVPLRSFMDPFPPILYSYFRHYFFRLSMLFAAYSLLVFCSHETPFPHID